MTDTLTGIIAKQKLASIKKNYRVSVKGEEASPESKRKLEEKIEKDINKREKEKQKREEMHQERDRQREKLRSKIKEKYGLDKDENVTETRDKKKSKKKSKKLKEKDFYKYNKAMPDEKGKKKEHKEDELDSGKGAALVSVSTHLAEKNEKTDKNECVIS